MAKSMAKNKPTSVSKKEKDKTVRTFAAAAFLNDMGSDMIFPIWPIFLTSILGANMAVLGLIDGLGDAFVSLSQAGAGYASDRLKKRKVFIWLGYFFGGISRAGYAASTVWPQIIPFRILDRAGKIRDAPRDAIIADISAHGERGKNFGFLKAMDKAGAIVGIIICILLFNILGYQFLFFAAAIPSLIGALLVIKLIKEKKDGKIKLYKGIKLSNLTKDFRLLLILSALFALGSFSYSFILIFAKQAGFADMFIPVLYLVFTVVAALLSIPFGRLADKIGRKPVMIIAFALWALVCLIFILTQNYLFILLSFVLYGLHKAALDPVQKTFVSDLAPKKFRASALGGFQMVVGLCALPASLVAGILWDLYGAIAPFTLSLILTIAATVILFFIKESSN
ncbi:MAG: MFS transporter [archaeon]